MSIQPDLPTLDGALVLGPVFLAFELPGDPGHKGRPRARIVRPKGKKEFIHFYPDPETAAYEQALAQMAAICMRGKAPSERPLSVNVCAFLRVPKSWSARDREAALAGRILPTSRPDGDNYLKAGLDALNKICWLDDSQIIDAQVAKRYSTEPALLIEVREYIEPLPDSR